MSYTPQVNRVPLTQIKYTDKTYYFLPFDEETPEPLVRQISRAGILHPPIVKKTESGSFIIVAGRKRLQIAQNILNQKSCNCLVIPTELSELETLAIALEEGLTGSGLSPVIRAFFLQKVLRFVSIEEVAQRFMPLMGLAPQPYQVKQVLKLTELEPNLSQALHLGSLDEKTAYELIDLSFRDRLALYELINSLKLSVGNQRKITSLCRDLAKRQNAAILSVLTTPALAEILNHHDANPPQKTAKLMKYLKEEHAPRLIEAEKNFELLIKKLNLPSWITLTHSPAFEKDSLTLALSFNDQSELEKFWQDFCNE